jgi:outer membrane protein OmpA-like peptidoglycan-associated protein
MSAHTDQDPNLWKTLFWLLLACLIGVYWLYEHHTETLQRELASTKAALADASQRVATIDTELAKREAATARAEQQIARLRQEHGAETDALKAAHAETLATLKSQHADAVNALTSKHADTVAGMESSHAETVSQLESDLAESTQTAAAMQEELAGLRKRSETAERELEQHKASVTALNERLVEVTEENHELSAKLSADNETIAGLHYELNAANQLEAALRDKLERGAARQERLQTLVEKEEAAILDLQDKLVSLTRERETLASQADEATKAAAGEPTQWQEQLAASQDVIADLKAELEAAVQEREQAEAAMASSPEVGAEAERAIAELSEARARVQALEAQTAQLEEQLATRDAALEEARAAVAAAPDGDEAATLRTEVEALQTERAELGERIAELEAKLSQAQQASAALEDELAAAEAAHAEALTAAQAAGQASARRIQTLYREAAELGGQLTDDGVLLSLAGDQLQFASGTATLPEAELPSLDRIAELLKAQPALTIRIEGHTDSSGSAETNQALSLARAQAVMEALIERGVPASRVSAEGLGAARPIADNATEQGRRENRRVEVYAIDSDAGEG